MRARGAEALGRALREAAERGDAGAVEDLAAITPEAVAELSRHLEVSTLGDKSAAEHYYDEHTQGFYLKGWNPDHIHFGLFEPGECPGPGESLADSEGLARALERMIEVIIAPAGIEARDHVVDAGCGVGGTSIHLARTRGCTVTGVNLNRMQLEIAVGKAAEAGLGDRVRFEHADCSRRLPFGDNSIDVVVNIENACHYTDRKRFLHEVRRILKPGGTIVAMDWMARDGLAADDYEKFIVPLCRPFAVHGLESESTYTELLHEAGLEILQFEGFDGKDADNLRLVEHGYNLFSTLRLFGVDTPGVRGLIDQFEPLYEAWRSGNFELRRYCAQNPGAAPPQSA